METEKPLVVTGKLPVAEICQYGGTVCCCSQQQTNHWPALSERKSATNMIENEIIRKKDSSEATWPVVRGPKMSWVEMVERDERSTMSNQNRDDDHQTKFDAFYAVSHRDQELVDTKMVPLAKELFELARKKDNPVPVTALLECGEFKLYGTAANTSLTDDNYRDRLHAVMADIDNLRKDEFRKVEAVKLDNASRLMRVEHNISYLTYVRDTAYKLLCYPERHEFDDGEFYDNIPNYLLETCVKPFGVADEPVAPVKTVEADKDVEVVENIDEGMDMIFERDLAIAMKRSLFEQNANVELVSQHFPPYENDDCGSTEVSLDFDTVSLSDEASSSNTPWIDVVRKHHRVKQENNSFLHLQNAFAYLCVADNENAAHADDDDGDEEDNPEQVHQPVSDQEPQADTAIEEPPTQLEGESNETFLSRMAVWKAKAEGALLMQQFRAAQNKESVRFNQGLDSKAMSNIVTLKPDSPAAISEWLRTTRDNLIARGVHNEQRQVQIAQTHLRDSIARRWQTAQSSILKRGLAVTWARFATELLTSMEGKLPAEQARSAFDRYKYHADKTCSANLHHYKKIFDAMDDTMPGTKVGWPSGYDICQQFVTQVIPNCPVSVRVSVQSSYQTALIAKEQSGFFVSASKEVVDKWYESQWSSMLLQALELAKLVQTKNDAPREKPDKPTAAGKRNGSAHGGPPPGMEKRVKTTNGNGKNKPKEKEGVNVASFQAFKALVQSKPNLKWGDLFHGNDKKCLFCNQPHSYADCHANLSNHIKDKDRLANAQAIRALRDKP